VKSKRATVYVRTARNLIRYASRDSRRRPRFDDGSLVLTERERERGRERLLGVTRLGLKRRSAAAAARRLNIRHRVIPSVSAVRARRTTVRRLS